MEKKRITGRIEEILKNKKIHERTYKRIIRSAALWICTAAVMMPGTACGRREEPEGGKTYEIYYVNNDETKTVTGDYVSTAQDTESLLAELIEQLSTVPSKLEYKPPLTGSMELLGYTLDNGQLTMNFSERYNEMDSIKEVLSRAAVVRTLTQIDGIDHVSFTIQGDMLLDSSGTAIGTMSPDLFIDNAGTEINAYEQTTLHLYFANKDGTGLVEENRRNVVYSSNISLEKLVVEKLVGGPESQDAYPTVNPATKIVSVTVNDGVCYVNLDENFLNQAYSVNPEVTIYSITNSLVELSDVNKVQISVNGETNVSYREKIDLNNVFERNLDLLVPGGGDQD